MLKILAFLISNGLISIMCFSHEMIEFNRFNVSSSNLSKKKFSNFHEDMNLNVPQLIKKYGYPMEVHRVKTEDGYLITLHRIPGFKMNKNNTGRGTPVMLMHGIFGSSCDWLINGPRQSLGYILADHGYDVWIGNARGNRYSRKHISLNPDGDGKFWNFSWHEIGYYDLPAFIDHILKETGKEKLHYIGHSQGSTVFFVMASQKPQYNDKISLMQAMGPGAYISNMKSPFIRFIAPFAHYLDIVAPLTGFYEIGNIKQTKEFLLNFCDASTELITVCASLYYSAVGYSPDQINITRLPVYLSHFPAGCSYKQVYHFYQMFVTGKFRKYDYGVIKNTQVYGQSLPPSYNLSKVIAPVAIHYSDNDLFVHIEDVYKLYKKLPNVIGMYKVPDDKFNHADFAIAIDAPRLVFDTVRNLLAKY